MKALQDKSYNTYKEFPAMGIKIIEHLFSNNEDIWKLLKHNSPDALQKPNLTIGEKRALIYTGEGVQTEFRIFRQPFIEDVFEDVVAQLRVYNSMLLPINRVHGVIDFCFEIVVHNKIIAIEGGYLNRMEVILQQLIGALNGTEIGGVGKFFFNQEGQYTNRAQLMIYNNRNYVGYKLIMSTRTGAE